MSHASLVVSLPIADRPTAYRFYREGLGFEPVGEPAGDGIPEPLQFELGGGTRLVLVPAGGFGWVIGENEVAARGQSECVLGLGAQTDAEVVEVVERAREAGASIVTEPGQQPLGFAAAFADPDGHIWMVRAEASPA